MKILTFPSTEAEKRIKTIADRSIHYRQKDYTAVNRILKDVKKLGDQALLNYTHRFDAPNMGIGDLRVTKEEIAKARKAVNRKFLQSLNRAVDQIKAFHRLQQPQSWISTQRPGTLVGQQVRPVSAAGIYVPGGKGGQTPLISSVLMGGIPAAIAGVSRTVMVTPPRRDGSIHPSLLVAAQKVGIKEIYKVGSAWAIAALAYGTETIGNVDVIVGPGNLYVTLAKKMVSGTVGIDMIAGPSEILILADQSANPDFVAADLLSQAEHDPLASAILVTPSSQLAREVVSAITPQLNQLERKEIAQASLKKYGAVLVVSSMTKAIGISNRIAPEHLELHVEDPFAVVGQIQNAGAVFLGQYTPEPIGDYIAGPNHVLPTAGTARFASALSVDHFMKKTSIIHYSPQAFKKEAADVIRLAETEGLTAHVNAVRIRLQQQ